MENTMFLKPSIVVIPSSYKGRSPHAFGIINTIEWYDIPHHWPSARSIQTQTATPYLGIRCASRLQPDNIQVSESGQHPAPQFSSYAEGTSMEHGYDKYAGPPAITSGPSTTYFTEQLACCVRILTQDRYSCGVRGQVNRCWAARFRDTRRPAGRDNHISTLE